MKSEKAPKRAKKTPTKYIKKSALSANMLKTYDKLTKNNEEESLDKKQA